MERVFRRACRTSAIATPTSVASISVQIASAGSEAPSTAVAITTTNGDGARLPEVAIDADLEGDAAEQVERRARRERHQSVAVEASVRVGDHELARHGAEDDPCDQRDQQVAEVARQTAAISRGRRARWSSVCSAWKSKYSHQSATATPNATTSDATRAPSARGRRR